mgnify:FL=1
MPIIRSVFVIQALCLRICCCGKRFRRRGAQISSSLFAISCLQSSRACAPSPAAQASVHERLAPASRLFLVATVPICLPLEPGTAPMRQRQVSCARSDRWAALRPAGPLVQQRYAPAGRDPHALSAACASPAAASMSALPLQEGAGHPRVPLLQDLHQDVLGSACCISGAPPPKCLRSLPEHGLPAPWALCRQSVQRIVQWRRRYLLPPSHLSTSMAPACVAKLAQDSLGSTWERLRPAAHGKAQPGHVPGWACILPLGRRPIP